MTIINYRKGINQDLKGGILCFDDGTFEAFTMTETKKYKTLRGARNFMAKREYTEVKEEVQEPELYVVEVLEDDNITIIEHFTESMGEALKVAQNCYNGAVNCEEHKGKPIKVVKAFPINEVKDWYCTCPNYRVIREIQFQGEEADKVIEYYQRAFMDNLRKSHK